jgi:acyl carrier protein
MQSLRNKLVAALEGGGVELNGHLKDDTPLIKSGVLDSLGLFKLALFVESEIGREVDVTAFDIATEWNTITDILKFINKLRPSG